MSYQTELMEARTALKHIGEKIQDAAFGDHYESVNDALVELNRQLALAYNAIDRAMQRAIIDSAEAMRARAFERLEELAQ